MKILMVSSFLPYPLVNGGNIRLYNLLKNLSKRYDVTLICEKREFQKEKDTEEVEKFCKKVITIEREKQWSIENILKAAFSLSSFLVVGHTNREMKRRIYNELKENHFDLIHVETFYVMQNLPKTSIPIVLVEHNIEYSVYERYTKLSPFFLKPFLYWDVKKMERKEKSSWKKTNTLVAVSEKEKEIMNTSETVFNGVDTEKFKFQSSNLKFNQEEKRILFIGDFKWIENRDIARQIIKKIWPEIKSKVNVRVKLWIVGKKIQDSIRNLTSDPDVIFDENAPDETSNIYRKAFILVSPIRVGGGTSFKILEAMSSGIPVITTPLGAEGITNGNELIVANNASEISDAVLKLMNDKLYYDTIAKRARRLIEKKFDWKKIIKQLEKVYDNVAKKND